MNTFRFIHTGDIHLDSPLKGLAGQEGAAAERIRTATRAAFSNLIDTAIEEEIAFVIIAGELYDGDWRDYQTGLFFGPLVILQMGRPGTHQRRGREEIGVGRHDKDRHCDSGELGEGVRRSKRLGRRAGLLPVLFDLDQVYHFHRRFDVRLPIDDQIDVSPA
jgi:hypothetical protein